MQIRDRNRDKETLALNLTPLIDIVFLLLLFFMVSTTFKQSKELSLDLPDVSAQKQYANSKSIERGIEIGINTQGQYFLQQRSLNSSDVSVLKRALRSLIAKNDSPEITIVGDKLAPHQSVVGAMDVVGQLGIKQIKIKANTQNKVV